MTEKPTFQEVLADEMQKRRANEQEGWDTILAYKILSQMCTTVEGRARVLRLALKINGDD